MEHHAHLTSLIQTRKRTLIIKEALIKISVKKSQRLLRLSFKNYSFIETKQTKQVYISLIKSSVKWAVDIHHGSKVRLWDITRKKYRWFEPEKMYTSSMIKKFKIRSCTKSKRNFAQNCEKKNFLLIRISCKENPLIETKQTKLNI